MTKKNILLAEDDEGFRSLICNALAHLGYDSVEAENGLVALEQLDSSVDLMLVDIGMPKMNGFELIRRVRVEPGMKDIPIIVITGLDSKDQRMKAIECGANDFISKPVDLTELKIRVASLLRIREFQDELKDLQNDPDKEKTPGSEVFKETLARVTGPAKTSEEVRQDTMENLALALEQRDVDPSRHLHRMSEYSALLALAAGLSSHEAEVIKMASVMHDVGKLAVRNSIIHKPGPLTPQERKEMEIHSEVGATMLAGSQAEFMKLGEVIARTHHERWDGTGYPHGLRGEDIPQVGRITAIADVFDALTSVRTYKEAFPLNKAWEIMEKGRGTHFDPILLDLFFAKRKAVEEIYHRGA